MSGQREIGMEQMSPIGAISDQQSCGLQSFPRRPRGELA